VAKRLGSLILFIGFVTIIPTSAYAQATVIWYLPHPDDETIGMADSIHQSILAGNRNYFIYFTKGESSFARHQIRDPDGQKYLLTKEEFGEARVRETLAALQILGVEAHQVLFLDFPDGALPFSAAVEIMRCFAALYPQSIHRTVSQYDPHEDHQTLALALASVSAEKDRIIYPEYFRIYSYCNHKQADHTQMRKVLYPKIKVEALAELSYFNPEEGRFALAAKSTPDLIKGALVSDYEYLDLIDHQDPVTKRSLTLGVTMSNLDVGLYVPVFKQINIVGLYDFKSAAGLAEVNLRLADSVPCLQLSLGLGYHFGYEKLYISTSASLDSYFIKLRHVPHGETLLGIGISTLLHQR
jgi:LmbE family N-acetylglucosaminyl deacetylase